MRHAEPVREGLQPARLLDRVLDPDRRLHVDHPIDVLEARLGQEVVGPVALASAIAR